MKIGCQRFPLYVRHSDEDIELIFWNILLAYANRLLRAATRQLVCELNQALPTMNSVVPDERATRVQLVGYSHKQANVLHELICVRVPLLQLFALAAIAPSHEDITGGNGCVVLPPDRQEAQVLE